MKSLILFICLIITIIAIASTALVAFPNSPVMIGGSPSIVSSFPLDGLPTPAFAYSLRRLLTSYNGKAINIRRAAGSPSTTDIGFTTSGDFDSAAFNTFCAGTTCFLSSTGLYDQSGNGINCGQATAANQPQVVLASLGGRASLQTTGFTGKMYCQTSTNSLLNFTGAGHSVFYVIQYTATTDGGGTGGGRGDALEVVSHYSSTNFQGWAADAGDTGRAGSTFVYTDSVNGGPGTSDGAFGHLTAINDGVPHFAGWTFTSGTVNIYQDASKYTSATTFTTPVASGQGMTLLAAGDTVVDAFFSGNFGETYGWGSTLSAGQITSLNSNAAAYYAVVSNTVACDYGRPTTLPIGQAGTDLAAAGLTHCVVNLDLTDNSGAVGGNGWIMNDPTTWLNTCKGTSSWGLFWLMWANQDDATNADVSQAACSRVSFTTDLGTRVLTYQYAVADAIDANHLGLNLSWPICGSNALCFGLNPALPNNIYTETTYRISAGTSQTLSPIISSLDSMSVFDGDTNIGASGGYIDFIGREANANNASSAYNVDNYINTCGGQKCGIGKFAAPDLGNVHTIATLVTSSTSPSSAMCWYIDTAGASLSSPTGGFDGTYCTHIANFVADELNAHNRRYMLGTGQPSASTINNTIVVMLRKIRIFSCATYVGRGNNCNSTVVFH